MSLFAFALALAAWYRCPPLGKVQPLARTQPRRTSSEIIHDTIKTTPHRRKNQTPPPPTRSSGRPPVNGLVARIELDWARYDYLVRLKNVSQGALTVPIGNPVAEGAAPFFEVEFRQGASDWKPITGTSRFIRFYGEPFGIGAPARPRRQARPNSSDRPWVTLQPGEDCLALVSGFPPEGTGEPKFVRVVFRQTEPVAHGRWKGTLETPAQAIRPRGQSRALRSAQAFPAHFPEFSYQQGGVVLAEAPGESSVRLLDHSNLPLIGALAFIDRPKCAANSSSASGRKSIRP